MNNFSNCTFENTTVRLDNTTYKNCVFTHCVIEYAGQGPIGLDSCTFNDCQWTLVGAAQHTMQFLASMYHGMGDFGQQMVEATFNNIKQAPLKP
ncbi:hypothetical protein M634_22470 [Vibrio parahaemolyticus O1:Kuk str. FDA_R31]|nr:hypothetical protein M634_22470 [Vibrio parahaemolyticus O1:Kuk str. FDA_R31]EGR0313594.1 hypothetical protein [Vibrio parahaemolyticus]EJB0394012.1 hypothetical protein [Vibrio parahaemolyticus]EJB5290068.1 hypothetical protein [Vibrio parahaemolyticus]EJG2015368.1 hypothetical protein [Vibrio parahaemolyticus]